MHRDRNLTWRTPKHRPAVAIYGPTSSGKTALSLDVCEAAAENGLRPVVLNADSRQVYVGMDIGTSKRLLTEIAELDRRYQLIEQARRPGRRRNVVSQTHGYREFVSMAASTGKAIAELDGASLACARAEALGHIRAYSRRQRSWFRKLGVSRVDHRSAVKTIVSGSGLRS